MRERSDSDNPMNYNPDVSKCAFCGAGLPEITDNNLYDDTQYFAFNGFCGAKCAAHSLACKPNQSYTTEFMTRIARAIK